MGNTRERLLDGASAVFADKGYHATTVAEICEHADANIAAVNYHFGSKDALYDEVLRHTMRIAETEYPLDGGLPEDAPAEDRFRAYVFAMLSRVLSTTPGSLFSRLVAHERSRESTVAHKLEPLLQRNREPLSRIIVDLAGGNLDDEGVRSCGNLVLSMCVFHSFNWHARRRFMEDTGGSPEAIRHAANQIAAFAMAGIQAMSEGSA